MSFLKDIEKLVKPHHIVILIGIVVVVFALMQYSNKKDLLTQGYADQGAVGVNSQPKPLSASVPVGVLDQSPDQGAPVSGEAQQANFSPPNCNSRPVLNPSELLPKDANSEWSRLNPPSNNPLGTMGLLSAQQIAGVNTVGSSLRNANLQVRSEPPNPQTQVSPWLNTTIEPDLMRQPLEIGCPCPGASPQ